MRRLIGCTRTKLVGPGKTPGPFSFRAEYPIVAAGFRPAADARTKGHRLNKACAYINSCSANAVVGSGGALPVAMSTMALPNWFMSRGSFLLERLGMLVLC